ncbi:unnamed protein product [Amoebophrya sp. A120]|nr:unnamed protein product [Amoebophrya sp. A120]|eukprot:GSA120T00014894001.1
MLALSFARPSCFAALCRKLSGLSPARSSRTVPLGVPGPFRLLSGDPLLSGFRFHFAFLGMVSVSGDSVSPSCGGCLRGLPFALLWKVSRGPPFRLPCPSAGLSGDSISPPSEGIFGDWQGSHLWEFHLVFPVSGVCACSTSKGPRLCLSQVFGICQPWPLRLGEIRGVYLRKRRSLHLRRLAPKLLWLRQPQMSRLRKLWRVSRRRKVRSLVASRGRLSCLFPGWREAFVIDSRLMNGPSLFTPPVRAYLQSCTRRRATTTGEQINKSLLHDPAAAQQSRPRRDHAVLLNEAPYYAVAPPGRNDEVEDLPRFVLERARGMRGRAEAAAVAVPQERKSRPRRRVPGVRKTGFFTTAAAVAVSCSRFHDLLHFTVGSSAAASAAAQESGAVGGSTSSSGASTSTTSSSEQGTSTSSNTRHLSAAERLEEEMEQYEPIKGPRMQTGNGGYYRNQFWDMSLVGFSPQTLLSFYLESGSEQHFFHDVEKAPEVFRGGYFLMDESYRGSDSDDNTDFHILDPDGELVYTQSYGEDGMFEATAKKPGTYTMVMPNNSNQKAMVNFFFQSGQRNNVHEDYHEVTTLEESVMSIKRKLQDIQTEGTYLWMRQKAHLHSIESVNNRALWFCIVELLTLLALVVFQVYYVKNLITEKAASRAGSKMHPGRY